MKTAPPAFLRFSTPLLAFLGLLLLVALISSGCDAARQIPGEAEYLGRGIADWGGEVIGVPPEEY